MNFAKHNIHGLTYQPRYQEGAYEHDEVDIVLLRLYSQFKTEKRTVVAYKGGHVENDLLNKLNIPCLDVETWGCPKYEQLKHKYSPLSHGRVSGVLVMVSNLCQVNNQFPHPVIFGKNNIKVS